MAKYRIYRTFEIYGYQDVEAVSEAEAIAKVKEYDTGEPHDNEWQCDGCGTSQLGPMYEVYSVDGKRV